MEPVERKGDRWLFSGALIAAGGLLYVLKTVLLPFVAAFALAYIFSPVVTLLKRRLHLPRPVGTLLLFAGFAGILGIIWGVYGGEITAHFRAVGEDAPGMVRRFIRNMVGADQVEIIGKTIRADDVASQLISRLQGFFVDSMGAMKVIGVMAGVALNLVVMVVALIYFLAGGESLIEGVIGLAPPERKGEVRRIVGKIDQVLGRFLRGIAVIVTAAALIAWVALRFAFGLPNAGLFAVAIGFLEIIPGLGPILSGLVTSIGAFGSGGMSMALKVIGFYIGLRLTIDQILGPLVLGRAVTLPPFVVLFALFAGASIYGLLGLLIAVPATAVIRVVIRERHQG